MMVRESVQASTTNTVASEGDELHHAPPRQKSIPISENEITRYDARVKNGA